MAMESLTIMVDEKGNAEANGSMSLNKAVSLLVQLGIQKATEQGVNQGKAIGKMEYEKELQALKELMNPTPKEPSTPEDLLKQKNPLEDQSKK